MTRQCRSDCCRGCEHFVNDPAELEAALPGLRSLSSAYISARADDGLCRRHQRHVGARRWCVEFRARETGAVEPEMRE